MDTYLPQQIKHKYCTNRTQLSVDKEFRAHSKILAIAWAAAAFFQEN